MIIPTLPPTTDLPRFIAFDDCKRGQTSAKTGCTPEEGGGEAGGGDAVAAQKKPVVPVDIKTFPNGTRQLTTPNGDLVLSPKEGALRVTDVEVDKEARGKGEGTSLYLKAIALAKSDGVELQSDVTVAPDAANIWEKLGSLGFDVERHPDAEQSKEGTWFVRGGDLEFSVYRLRP